MTIRNLFHQEWVIETAERRTLRWFGHAITMGEMKLKVTMEACLDGRGRPSLERTDYTENLANRRGKTLLEVKPSTEPVSYTHLDVYKRQGLTACVK